jgi:crotonobetainyl-CoA:carnitine CoA-transferase CaiB-like acyl-CoA transferase
MTGPLEGIRVVELGFWVAGPSAAGVLCDWGADVIKIEPPDGDPYRGLFLHLAGKDQPLNPPFELDNRGKRSVVLDLATGGGRTIALALLERADVFVTNIRRPALRRFGLDYEALSARFPRLVYASVTGYGEDGPDRDRPAYDIGAFWARTGIAASLTPPGTDPPYQRGAFGDHIAGATAAGAISAALLARERTGRGQLVSTSLLRIGIFTLGWDISTTMRLGVRTRPIIRSEAQNPLISSYQTSDERWLWLLGLQGDRHWPDLIRAIERPEWLADPRFATMRGRRDHCAELVGLLDEVFRARTLAAWGEILDRAGMWWAPVQTTAEVIVDPQAIAAGAFVDVPTADGATARTVATPVDYSDTPWKPRAPAPELGQHTEEVLLELGYDWDGIGALKEQKVIP